MSESQPIDFTSHMDSIDNFVELHDERQADLARQYWHDIHRAHNYLSFRITAKAIADGELTKKIIEDFTAPADMSRRDRSGPERIFLAMRKHAIRIVDNPDYAPIIHGGDFDDPYAEEFDKAKKTIRESWRSGRPEDRAVHIVWQLHRLSISSPSVDIQANPYIPEAITSIMKWSNGKELQ